MKSLILYATVITAMACGTAVGATPPQADTAAAEEADTIFAKTSFALIIAKVPNGIEAKNMTYAIQEPRLVSLGGRWFVLGKPVPNDHNPANPFVSKIGIAWEHVIEFSLFTREQFKEYVEEKRAISGQ